MYRKNLNEILISKAAAVGNSIYYFSQKFFFSFKFQTLMKFHLKIGKLILIILFSFI